tara:strand:+ start:161 stop:331 length:171 start_codon:yes stop_codon:yes gene_type:complete
MAKLTKAQTRKRLDEAASKISLCFMDGDRHLTDSQLKKLLQMRMDLHNMCKKMRGQ